ncbi:DEAD/DEAH box helicase [Kitasatospora atroaurantiaca]|uniref:Helicase-like protein n=1 Tax=Kitasatospora atroaurantiaca TaxID=285545 RepID=A0A561F1V9_9ACTN|nr:DEAD/DEAH box helicase [Kitasatospora atroaurantiaca]TWE21843.1 helicase-like protein [Kitasatospora atroaurantiaca]
MDTAPVQPPAAATPALAAAGRTAEAGTVPAARPVPSRLVIAELRDFQKDAVSAVWREVRDGGRCIVEAACGSGKTLIAAACAHRLALRGRVLVLVPTIELLEQTANSWSTQGGRRGLAIAACSRDEALEQAEGGGHLETEITTQAARVADLVAAVPTGRPVTVYATYASLERIVQAHRQFGLPAWDLVVVDEAHRTAGAVEKPWAAVHEDDQVPALRRVYFTATPRVADAKPGAPDDLSHLTDASGDLLVYSMSDPTVYGNTVFRWSFSQGVAHGWIADYEVLVPVITDQDLQELLALPAVADLRSQRTNEDLQRMALQVAVLRAIADLGLRRVITFHSRIPAARQFAATLVETADLLPDYDRPERLWANAVAGTDRLRDRRAAFAEFAAHTGEDGEECGILSNARLLSEGIDLPAVDAICFADAKSSVIDIVQAVGRAVRQKPQQGKTARVIIPVYLPAPQTAAETEDVPDADPAKVTEASPAVRAEAATEIDASAFRTVWRVLQALAAHDSRVVGRIAELRTHRSQQQQPAAAGPGGQAGAEAEEGEGEVSPVEWLRIDARANSAAILRALKLRAFSPRAVEWERMHKLAAAFHAEHGHLDATDRERDGDLVGWLVRQRYLRGAGLLDAARVSELDALGMIWDKHGHAWERGYAYARAIAARTGHLAIPAAEKLDGYAVGAWVGRQRKNPKLTARQDAALTALDALWRLEPDWNRSYRRLVAYLAAGGTLTGPANRTGGADDPTFRPGAWLRKQNQLAAAGKHTAQQTALLDALGAWRTT